jgi:preprotein translocase subunit YajC
MNEMTSSLIVMVVFIAAMYFLLIRPQKKKDKQIQAMRNNLQVGDEIITIGGIKGKIVKTKDDSIVIQVGADKVKFEMMRWAVSSVVSSTNRKAKEEVEEAPKKSMPKRLKKSSEAEEATEE